VPAQYLVVDGHSIIFAWPNLRRLHARRPSLARETLINQLRHYQDWTDVHVAIVFDGRGESVTTLMDPHDVQIFYARRGQSADAIIERLASKYAARFEITVATSDSLVMETVYAAGAACVSPEKLRQLLDSVEKR
jgi:uncharacterized protein